MTKIARARLGTLLAVTPALLWAAGIAACSAGAAAPKTEHDPAKDAALAAVPADKDCPSPPPCGSQCDNHPFVPTECKTTSYGPARANVILDGSGLTSPNMLYCMGGSYALCFFSGPPHPSTGDTAPLPCVQGDKSAACVCRAFTSQPDKPYFVDINAIESLGIYYETVGACGQDGSGCPNIKTCKKDGSGCPTVCRPGYDAPGCVPQAPVCNYIRNQKNNESADSFMPGADMISTFSFAMSDNGDYTLGSKDCTNPGGVYAGCMTAGCKLMPGSTPKAVYNGDLVTCDCPLFNGPYQVGQNNVPCTIPSDPTDKKSYVWSAAYTP